MARKIGIVGAGAIGGYFAAQLAESGYEVVVLARGKNRDVLSTDGITITMPIMPAIAPPVELVTSSPSTSSVPPIVRSFVMMALNHTL